MSLRIRIIKYPGSESPKKEMALSLIMLWHQHFSEIFYFCRWEHFNEPYCTSLVALTFPWGLFQQSWLLLFLPAGGVLGLLKPPATCLRLLLLSVLGFSYWTQAWRREMEAADGSELCVGFPDRRCWASVLKSLVLLRCWLTYFSRNVCKSAW